MATETTKENQMESMEGGRKTGSLSLFESKKIGKPEEHLQKARIRTSQECR
jgi:hypothetical protein